MKNLKNKNIFDNFNFDRSNLTIKNIILYFGNRVIDLFTHHPTDIVNNNFLEKLELNYKYNFLSIDVNVKKLS